MMHEETLTDACVAVLHAANGSTVDRTILITNREDMTALNALYKQGDGFGERSITAPKQSKAG